MCRGEFITHLDWLGFVEAANSGNGFESLPRAPGVYVVRVAKLGDKNVEHIKTRYLSSPFLASLRSVDRCSERFFRSIGAGSGWGWRLHPEHQTGTKRLERLDRLPFRGSALTCRVLYIGRANNLRRRMWELTSGGHTVNHPFWALLMAGWQFDVAVRATSLGQEVSEEARIKQAYRTTHGSRLPALVHR